MPLYEYQCEKCGEVFELIQKFADDPLTVHPVCGGPVHRLLSAPALVFKGSGWYATDYAKSSGSPSHNGSNNGEAGRKSEPAGGKETKSAPAPDIAKPASSSSSEKK